MPRTGFDLLGNTAVIELKEGRKNAKKIAQKIMKENKHIKSVYIKTGAHRGKYRIEPVKWVFGEKRKQVFCREWGCSFRVSLGKVFYSPRLGTERQRICRKIKKSETVGVFFAGVGPFAIIFAKHSKAKKVVAIEWNPAAFKDLEYNVAKNKVSDKVEIVHGNVKGKVRHYKSFFDRIVMPSPHTAKKYFPSALSAVKKGGIIHYYAITEAKSQKKEFGELEKIAKKRKKNLRLLFSKKARPYSKFLEQRVLDIKVC